MDWNQSVFYICRQYIYEGSIFFVHILVILHALWCIFELSRYVGGTKISCGAAACVRALLWLCLSAHHFPSMVCLFNVRHKMRVCTCGVHVVQSDATMMSLPRIEASPTTCIESRVCFFFLYAGPYLQCICPEGPDCANANALGRHTEYAPIVSASVRFCLHRHHHHRCRARSFSEQQIQPNSTTFTYYTCYMLCTRHIIARASESHALLNA